MMLYHGTDREYVARIREEGINASQTRDDQLNAVLDEYRPSEFPPRSDSVFFVDAEEKVVGYDSVVVVDEDQLPEAPCYIAVTGIADEISFAQEAEAWELSFGEQTDVAAPATKYWDYAERCELDAIPELGENKEFVYGGDVPAEAIVEIISAP